MQRSCRARSRRSLDVAARLQGRARQSLYERAEFDAHFYIGLEDPTPSGR